MTDWWFRDSKEKQAGVDLALFDKVVVYLINWGIYKRETHLNVEK
jgi:hypothetical protein